MLDFWVKFKEIELYVEHEVDNPIIVDEIFLLTTRDGDVKGLEVHGEGDDEGVESDGECDLEKVESSGEGDVGELMNMLVILQHLMDWIMLLLHVVEKRRMEIRLRYGTQMNMEAWLSPVKMKNMKMDDKQFKSAIRKYFKECRRQLNFIKNESKRVVVRCIASPNYPWRIRASYSPIVKCLQIKTFQDEHHCPVSFKNKMVTTDMIAQYSEETIKDHPKMKLREIQRSCASEMHVNVTIDCFYRAKKIVNEKMAGNQKEEFGLLWDYAHELWSKMPGSTIKMAVQKVTARGWKAGCRPLIGLDGCFIKGQFKSEFLTAVGRDANNQMFPVAWAVVEVECTNSWGSFLSLLPTDLGLEDGYGYTIISDQQKIVNCTTEREWEDLCSALEKKDKDAYNNLMKMSSKIWTREFLGTTCKSDIVDNNLCEAFNSSIVEAKFKSIIRMLEDIRTKMMTRIVQKKEVM
ncbi:uncharacterized protein [Gossypium hirsutum]|uniref:Transposase MuDR plant domain-containing protein n=1 Tax=Gossypium hirsutum TaxID=3635 RepID=A0A1U8PXP1_GOSHI|nr:uncharacterized protein LOC107963050 [Gossypium hirsutum]